MSKNNDFNIIQDILCVYCKGSGSKLNVPKTKGVWLGKWKDRSDNPCGFNWCSRKIKNLGIVFGNDVTPEDNWGPRVNKFKCRWSKRSLTLIGKAVIINTLVGSGLNYLGSIISCPREWINKIDKSIWKFYWDDKVEKIKRNTINGPRDKGGTGLVNIECKLMSIKVQWFFNYIKSCGKWKRFFDYWLGKVDNKLGWYVLSNSRNPVNTTTFYQDLIRAFKAVNGKINCSFSVCSETREVPLWNNVCVTDDDTELNSPLLASYNFHKVNDLVVNDHLIPFRVVAKKCNVPNIIAGRLVGRIDNHINHKLIEEKRIGPPNHVSNWLVLFNRQSDEYANVSNTNAKINYQNLILARFVVPKVQIKWQEILNYHIDVDWTCIWKNGSNNFIPTKDFLSKIGKTKDNICPLCNVKTESHEHLFIYCVSTLNAWIFVERILRNYSGKKHFYLNDSNRILGYKMSPVHNAIIAKMLRVI